MISRSHMKTLKYKGSLYVEAGAMKVFVDGKMKAWNWALGRIKDKEVVYWDQSSPNFTLYTGPIGADIFKLFARLNPKGDRKKLTLVTALKDFDRKHLAPSESQEALL